MATLVQFLAAGVNGAEGGTATFLLRGTASSAEEFLYEDFERTSQPGTNVITLDVNGAAEVYCSAYVDVVLTDALGSVLRTVTVGNGAANVEVRSTSFTGTDYDGDPANTLNQPITLKAVLDKWILSAGAPDWQVLRDGVATDLSVAVSGFAGMFVNVKDPTYGATGDGVTDDTTAILAATTAANGGIVFFPAGTYKITTLSLSGANINWLGSGAGATIISGTTSTNLISLTDNTNAGWKNFTGLSFTSSGSYSRLFLLEQDQNVTFARCAFDGTNCAVNSVAGVSNAGFSNYLFTDCAFNVGLADRCIYNPSDTGERHISIKGCIFTASAGFAGSIVAGPDMVVDGNTFDASAITAGVYWHVNAHVAGTLGQYVGSFTNNKFIDGGSDGFAFRLTDLSAGCAFSESGNIFIGFVAPAATLEKGHIYEITDSVTGIPGYIHLGSRKGRTVHLSINATAAMTVSACLEAETVVVEHTGLTPTTFTVPALLPGLSGRIVVFHTGNPGTDIATAFVDSAGLGSFLFTTTLSNEAMVGVIADDECCSCGYWTTVRDDGVFRSLITAEVNHHA